MTPRLPLLALLSALAAASVAAATLGGSSFLGAPAGVAQAFETVPLPPVAAGTSTASALPGVAALRAVAVGGSPFAPPLQQLLQGNTVITSEAQMRAVWKQLFAVPYAAAAFDFEHTFVVLMGGGTLANAWFDISSVETVQASYADPGGPGGQPSVPFLCVTATTFLSGVQPSDPPPPAPALSAVKIDRSLLGDVVFHRTLIMGV